jgi:hypothetical protein
MVPSRPSPATELPSGLNDTELTGSVPPDSIVTVSPTTARTRTVPSSAPVASRPPSGLNAAPEPVGASSTEVGAAPSI